MKDSNYYSCVLDFLKSHNLPLTGWYNIDVTEMDEEVKCEVCGCDKVRFVHCEANDATPVKLRVGCVCAGNLEGDVFAARARDDIARKVSRLRKRVTNWENWTRPEFVKKAGGWVLTIKNKMLVQECTRGVTSRVWVFRNKIPGSYTFYASVHIKGFQKVNLGKFHTAPAVKDAVFGYLRQLKMQETV